LGKRSETKGKPPFIQWRFKERSFIFDVNAAAKEENTFVALKEEGLILTHWEKRKQWTKRKRTNPSSEAENETGAGSRKRPGTQMEYVSVAESVGEESAKYHNNEKSEGGGLPHIDQQRPVLRRGDSGAELGKKEKG